MQYTANFKYRRRDDIDPRAHYIEESVQVYLMRHPDGLDSWGIDPSCLDGYALDSSIDGYPLSEECLCGDDSNCERAAARMAEAHLPNAHQLLTMLADTLGYSLTKR